MMSSIISLTALDVDPLVQSESREELCLAFGLGHQSFLQSQKNHRQHFDMILFFVHFTYICQLLWFPKLAYKLGWVNVVEMVDPNT